MEQQNTICQDCGHNFSSDQIEDNGNCPSCSQVLHKSKTSSQVAKAPGKQKSIKGLWAYFFWASLFYILAQFPTFPVWDKRLTVAQYIVSAFVVHLVFFLGFFLIGAIVLLAGFLTFGQPIRNNLANITRYALHIAVILAVFFTLPVWISA